MQDFKKDIKQMLFQVLEFQLVPSKFNPERQVGNCLFLTLIMHIIKYIMHTTKYVLRITKYIVLMPKYIFYITKYIMHITKYILRKMKYCA